MRTSGDICFICGSGEFDDADRFYRRCRGCGHEMLAKARAVEPIINDVLSDQEIASFGILDRFKRRVLRSCMSDDAALLDIGTASGKFLYHNKQYFRAALGVEVTRECIDFARNRLGLMIYEDLAAIQDTVSVATLWHSLEHISESGIDRLFHEFARISAPDISVIISVPNGGSMQRSMLGEGYAYYDPASHLHQFTPLSLDRLLGKHGYVRERAFFSIAYAAFGSLQGLMNLFTSRHNYFYYRKKRGWTFNRTPGGLVLLDAYNYLLAAFVLVPAMVLTLLEALLKDKGAVLTICYRKKKPSMS